MLRRWVEPFTRSVGRLADPTAGYSQRKRKVKPVTIVTFSGPIWLKARLREVCRQRGQQSGP